MDNGECRHKRIVGCIQCERDVIENKSLEIKHLKSTIDRLHNNLASYMSKRESFAQAAMQGMMANNRSCEIKADAMSRVALDQADSLLRALEGQQLSTQEEVS